MQFLSGATIKPCKVLKLRKETLTYNWLDFIWYNPYSLRFVEQRKKKKNLILIHSASTFLLHESKKEVVVPIHQKIGLLQRMYHVDISFLCHFRLAWLGCYFVWKTQMVLYLARRGSRKVHQQRREKFFKKGERFCYRSGTIFALFYSCSTWNLKLDSQCGIIFGFSRRYIFQLSFQGSPY